MKKIVLIALVLTFASLGHDAQAINRRTLGGPCFYKEYPGQATVTAVEPDRSDASQPDRTAIKFSFAPKEKVVETFATTDGRIFTYGMVGSAYPTQEFVDKNGIKAGMTYDATMSVIETGTCTPILFDFPAWD